MPLVGRWISERPFLFAKALTTPPRIVQGLTWRAISRFVFRLQTKCWIVFSRDATCSPAGPPSSIGTRLILVQAGLDTMGMPFLACNCLAFGLGLVAVLLAKLVPAFGKIYFPKDLVRQGYYALQVWHFIEKLLAFRRLHFHAVNRC